MISSVELISNPVIATATPVNELSNEITTGMSAPPIGKVKKTPRSSAASRSVGKAQSGSTPSVATNQIARPSIASRTPPLTICCPGYVTGRPVITSWSLRNAIIEPERLIAPMIAESTSETATIASMFAPGAAVKYRTVEINAAAPPPAPL